MRSEAAVSSRTRGIVAFRVGDFWFGARVEETAGLAEAERLSPLPSQREPLAGVLAFRGGMVPALDLAALLDLEPAPPASPRYAMVLARGADRFGVVVPAMPRLISARDLKEADAPTSDSELGALIDTVYESGGERIHCLNYWSIIDSILPAGGQAHRPPRGAGKEARG
jgi:chemotaxis signal transduction protein